MQHRVSSRSLRAARMASLAALFVYLLLVRARGVADTFWLMGDQMRDWTYALASWRELRTAGTPSHVGGTTLGPVYYWTLWAIRHLIGPWTGNLPHAGAIGLSIVQSAADVFLLVAIQKKTQSWWLALAVVLIVATAPLDMALTAAMWNPALSVALVKVAIALVLLAGDRPSLWWTAGVTVAAWLAVEAHSLAIFVAGPVLAALVATELVARRGRAAFDRLRLIVEVIAILQVPFLVDRLRHPTDPVAPAAVVDGVTRALSDPASVRPGDVFHTVSAACGFVLLQPWSLASPGWGLLACLVAAAVRVRRDLLLASVTILPLVAFVAGFSLAQLPFDTYYVLPIAPAVGLTIGLALTVWRPAARPLAVAAAVAILVAQPWRYASARTLLRLPQYGVLVKGSREIRRRAGDVQNIETEFSLPDSTDPTFLYKVLGGRVRPGSRFTARIDSGGGVTFTAATP